MKQTVIEVQGEMQLNAILGKLHDRYHVEVALAHEKYLTEKP